MPEPGPTRYWSTNSTGGPQDDAAGGERSLHPPSLLPTRECPAACRRRHRLLSSRRQTLQIRQRRAPTQRRWRRRPMRPATTGRLSSEIRWQGLLGMLKAKWPTGKKRRPVQQTSVGRRTLMTMTTRRISTMRRRPGTSGGERRVSRQPQARTLRRRTLHRWALEPRAPVPSLRSLLRSPPSCLCLRPSR